MSKLGEILTTVSWEQLPSCLVATMKMKSVCTLSAWGVRALQNVWEKLSTSKIKEKRRSRGKKQRLWRGKTSTNPGTVKRYQSTKEMLLPLTWNWKERRPRRRTRRYHLVLFYLLIDTFCGMKKKCSLSKTSMEGKNPLFRVWKGWGWGVQFCV